jgi:thiol-disulfide isomerase/thioredoxin
MLSVRAWIFACACACAASCRESDPPPVKNPPVVALPEAPTSSSIVSAKVGPTASVSTATHVLAFDTINGQGRVELAGHISIVDFWATWCGPCKRAFPKLQALWDRYRDRGLVVIGLAMDDEPDAPLEFVRARQTTFPVGLDVGHTQYTAWKLTMMPSTVVLTPSGAIHRRYDGYHEGEDAELDRDIRELLGEK